MHQDCLTGTWDASNAHEVRPAAASPCMAASSDRVAWRTAATITDLDHAHRIADATERPFGTDANDQTAEP